MKILVGSKNPVKIKSVEEAFSLYFKNISVEGIEIDSGVPVQPVNDETYIGAQNRASKLKEMNDKQNIGADYFIGIEGGIVKQYNRWFAFGCMCIIDKENNIGFGNSPNFELPDMIAKKLLTGTELGEVMDEILNQQNTKQNAVRRSRKSPRFRHFLLRQTQVCKVQFRTHFITLY